MSVLGMVVVKRYGTGDERGELAEVVSSCDAPTYQLRNPDGSECHWRQDLTRWASPEETAEYWRQRAEIAERMNAKLSEVNSKLLDSNTNLVERLNRHGNNPPQL